METKTLNLPRFEVENKDLYLNLHLKNIGYKDTIVLRELDLEFRQNQRVCFIGKNGSGKSTLLKLISGDPSISYSGEISLSPKFRLFYYSQHFPEELLKQKISALRYFVERYSLKEKDATSHLAKHGLPYPQQIRPFSELSGGEKVRVLFSQISLLKPNLLLLDEPTNHLDIESIDVLIEYLKTYTGMILISSHSRVLINAIASDIYWINNQKLVQVSSFNEWLDARKEELKLKN